MMPGGVPDPDADENPTPYPFAKEYETMYCAICPAFSHIQAITAWRDGTAVDPVDVLDVARRMIKTDKPTRRAAGKLVDALCELTPKDAPIVAGRLRRVPLAETARQAKMRNRATAHARLKTLLARFPSLRALHHSAAK